MGIVVELDRSKVTFKDPIADFGFNRASVFVYSMHSFQIEFGIRFDPNPNAGLGRDPQVDEDWQIGIVQNVLFERLSFVYQDSAGVRPQVLQRDFMIPVVDVLPRSTVYPFYGGQDVRPGVALVTRPVSNITYTSKGYRETSAKVLDNKPDTLNMWDQPGGAAPFVKDRTFRLRSLEHVLIFQDWLVAIKAGEFPTGSPGLDGLRNAFIPKIVRGPVDVAVLASFPAFSLNFWAEFDLVHFRPRHPEDTPTSRWGLYGAEGYFPTKKVDHMRTGLGPGPSVKSTLGDGGRFPITIGPRSVDGAPEWLKSVGLHL